MFLPINIQMENRCCLIVGGSEVAARKCAKLVEYGALVTAVAVRFSDDPVWSSEKVTVVCKSYEPEQLEGMFLVIAATDDQMVNDAVLADSAERGVLAQRTDHADAGDFFLPATLRRGDLTISYGTNGVNPAFSRTLRDEAEGFYDDAFACYCGMIADLRSRQDWLKMDQKQRRNGLRAMARNYARLIGLIREGRQELAVMLLEKSAGLGKHSTMEPAIVSLIGAGPGDPGLITVKGAEHLRQADVVLHDGYANPELVKKYCPDAEHIDVGKHKGGICRTQTEINSLLLEKAKTGAVVVRLKGGDPLLFGRGGEEARMLAKNGIPFEIIPGVTSGLAVPAYCGIPVTDREFSSSVGFYSMHKKNGNGLSEDEWRRMANGPDTLVLLMGTTLLRDIAGQLIRYGRPANTPVALLARGTLPDQARYLGTLETIASLVEACNPVRPGLVVVGDVVNVIPDMDWFSSVTFRDSEDIQ